MKNFIGGGRELPQEQNCVCSIIQNNRYRLLLPLGRYSRSKFGTQRSDAVGVLTAYSQRPKAFLIIFCVLFSWSLISPVYGQEDKGLNGVHPLRIGQRIPDEFWTKEHLFFINGDTIRRTLEEHKGKMLVLDFWSSGCTPCLLHQKEIEHFKAMHPNDLAVVMVNSKKTREKYNVLVKHINNGRFAKAGMHGLISIIEDTYLENMFSYYCFPSYFWINESGVLQTHTFRNLLDREYVPPFLLKK